MEYENLFHWPFGPKNVFVCKDELEHNNDDEEYTCYTDGACDNMNGRKPGGSAYILIKENEIFMKESKGFLNTSNNRMEMLAIISALRHIPANSRVDVYSDSMYSIDIFTGKCRPKKNRDLVALFMDCIKDIGLVVFHWVRGHSGDTYNEMADKMAYDAYKEIITMHGIKESRFMLKK